MVASFKKPFKKFIFVTSIKEVGKLVQFGDNNINPTYGRKSFSKCRELGTWQILAAAMGALSLDGLNETDKQS